MGVWCREWVRKEDSRQSETKQLCITGRGKREWGIGRWLMRKNEADRETEREGRRGRKRWVTCCYSFTGSLMEDLCNTLSHKYTYCTHTLCSDFAAKLQILIMFTFHSPSLWDVTKGTSMHQNADNVFLFAYFSISHNKCILYSVLQY